MRTLPLLTGLLVLAACDPDKDPSTSTGTTVDADGDGYGGDTDCDDASAAVHPGADELCDGVDNDCDGVVDNNPSDGDPFFIDEDGDGFGTDDTTVACSVADGLATTDGDCDDTNPDIHPDATEVCGGADEDCDGLIDDADDSVDPDTYSLWFVDSDGDGHGDPDAATVSACADPSSDTTQYSATDTDCDDSRADVHPDATEVCDALDVDEDCDGLSDDLDDSVDLADASTWFPDADADGFGDAAHAGEPHCDDPSTEGDAWLLDATDCNDADGAIHPAAPEVCDDLDVDEDCDGLTDDDDDSVDLATGFDWFPDTDEDGYGDAHTAATVHCDDPSYAGVVFTLDSTDCDDGNIDIHPAATEVCDAADVDEDCDGVADDADSGVDTATHATWYVDVDADGHGDQSDAGGGWCDDPSTSGAAYSATADDCDDSTAAVSPSAAEVCDADDVDEDCSGLSDDDDSGVDAASFTDWTLDADGDGFGDDTATPIQQCEDPSTAGTTYVDDASDCDDSDSAVNPSATEVCDDGSVDEDCDGDIDDDDASLDTATASDWYVDDDLDGYGDETASAVSACADPSGATTSYVDDNTDCDDADADVNPGATEIYGDGADQTCTGVDYPTFSCPSGAYTVPGSYASLSAASNALGNGSSVQTICLSAGTHSGNATLYGNLRIVGEAAQTTTISGHLTVRTSVNNATIDIQGVTITNGVEVHDDSSAVFDLTIEDSIIEVVNQYGVHVDRDGYGTPNTTIERCVVYGDSPDAAIYFYDYGYNTTDRVYWTVTDSYITGGQWGIRTAVTTSSTRSPDQTFSFTGNTIEDASYGIFAVGRGSSSTTFRIYNNIIANNSRGFSYNGRGNMNNDYNLYWGNTSTNFYNSATGGSNRVTTDPGLSSDTPPVPSSTGGAAGAGTTSYANTTDYWTNPRSSPPSIGAVEPF